MNPLRIMLRLVAVLIALVVLAAACGSDGDDTVATGAGGDTSNQPEPGIDDPIPDQPADEPVADEPAPDDPGLPDGPLGAGPYPIAELNIEYTDGTNTTSYVISCLGDTATLIGDVPGVSDQRACLALADATVQSRLLDEPDGDLACSAIYGGPDVATITGRINDQPVATSVDLTNGCGISDWNDLLADILPTPSNRAD